jgi:hypothetical protein
MECKHAIIENGLLTERVRIKKDPVLESFEKQPKDVRLLTYKLLVDNFNKKYLGLNESQKRLLNKYITCVNDTTQLREYVQQVIPEIKKQLSNSTKKIDDRVVKIKVQKLSEMLCNVENLKTIKESHILSLLRYFDLVKELKEIQ